MTTNNGVPPALRPVLEALLGLGEALLRHGDDGVALDASKLGRACLAALAPDAEMSEGEPEYRCLRCQGPIPEDALRMGEFNHCSERCAAPLAESGAAAPDAELDRLLIEYARCQVHARYASRSQPEINRRAYAVEYAAAAIHAHVEREKREAREERLRDMDVPTRHRVPERATDATPGATWSHVREMHADALAALRSVGPPNCDQPDAGGGLYYPLLFLLAAVEAHERAIMIGLMAIVEESVPAPAPAPGDTSEAAFRDALHLPETSHVDLVRRREKEEG